ncbi:MAG TPA: PqiC family protein [Steroidobacteraceae bacterium]|nr:PqiC family protein [Steroidobacteraceae bacterium]
MKTYATLCAALGLLSACVTSAPYHYYVLNPQPPGAGEARKASAGQVTLRVSVPSLVDRPEMVLNSSAEGVIVLEHERWAAPLTDLMTQTLAQDIERRRGDLLVAGQDVVFASGPAIKIIVNVVQMSVRRTGQASIETQWRIVGVRTGKDQVGGEVFSAPLRQDDYAGVAQALSEALGLFADRLVAQISLVE